MSQLSHADEAAITAVMLHADGHRDDRKTMALRMGGFIGAPGDAPEHTCVVEVEGVHYRCVYSLEEQPAPFNWCRHVSFSCRDEGGQMQLDHVNALLWRFGLRSRLTTLDKSNTTSRENMTWIEVHNGLKIINLLEAVIEVTDPRPATITSYQAVPGVRGAFIVNTTEEES